MTKTITTAVLSFGFLLCGFLAADAATLTVTKVADTNDNICDADCSLREANFAAASGDVIEFASPLFDSAQTITLTLDELGIGKNLTVNGKGASLTSISGDNARRVFRVFSGFALTLNGVTITAGRSASDGNSFGGGIFNGGILTINNCVLSGNTVAGSFASYGGAIYNDDNVTMTMTNSSVSGNNLAGGPGANNQGGGIYNAVNTRVSITGSSISNNSGSPNRFNQGIGISNQIDAIMTITDSTISGNSVIALTGSSASVRGGGIYNDGTVTIINSTISGNRITTNPNIGSSGGGIYNSRQLTILNGTVTGNIAASGTSTQGGGIRNLATLRAVNTIISGNTSPQGADYAGSGGSFAFNVNNLVGGDARLAELADNGGATQTHALLSDSPAINAGNNCVLTTNRCLGTNNLALTTDQRGNGFPRRNGFAVDIGAVEVPSSVEVSTRTVDTISDDVALTACTTGANDCSLRGAILGAPLYATIDFSPALNNQTITLTLSSEIAINKHLTINGPGANLLTIDGGPDANRIFYIAGPDPTGVDVVIRGVTMQGGNGGGAGTGGLGGAICQIDNSLTLDGVVLLANSAINGGAIYAQKNLIITNSTLSQNFASGGGAIEHSNLTTDSLFYIENSTISGNQASGGASAIRVSSQNPNSRLTSVTITDNYTDGPGNVAVNASSSSLQVSNTIIAGNRNSTLGNEANITGSFTNLGFNILSGNPLLRPLAYNGGPTRTHVPLTNSPAIDAGNNCVLTANGCATGNPALTTDQRGSGFPRLVGTNVDIGAVESSRLVVFNTANNGPGSLRQTIAEAAVGDTIIFDPTIFALSQTIDLTGGEIVINRNLTINGTGANLLTIDAANLSRIFNIQANSALTVSGIKLTRGRVSGAGNHGGCVLLSGVFNLTDGEVSNCSADSGGAVYSLSTGTINLLRSNVNSSQAASGGGGIFSGGALSLTDSIVENNSAGGGGGIAFVPASLTANITRSIVRLNTAGNSGGIFNLGTLNFIDSTLSENTSAFAGGLTNEGFANIVNSTVSGNRSTAERGGGIFNNTGRTLHLLNTTITNNRADAFAGAGIWNENPAPATVRARNTIIAGNISGIGNPVDYVGGMTDLGNNLINLANPGLTVLGNYGGATPTHALLPSSPALDAGNNCALTANTCGITHVAISADQRGINAPRQIGANVDIGAFERSITFNQANLPNGSLSLAYSQQLAATRQTGFAELLAPSEFSIVPVAGQMLPPGINLSSGGLLTGTPTAAGSFAFTVKATDSDSISGVQNYVIQVFVPTAANVSVSGRVFTADGRSLRGAIVTLTDANGTIRTTRSSSFGNFRFDEVEAGQTYTISVSSKCCQFTQHVVSVNEEITDLNLTAIE